MTLAHTRTLERAVAALMIAVAASLAVMASLHFAGVLEGSAPFEPSHAAVVEALIGMALLAGAALLLRGSQRRSEAALASVGFAIVGFCVGLSFTVRGAGAADIAYHAAVLPLLLVALAVLLRQRSAGCGMPVYVARRLPRP